MFSATHGVSDNVGRYLTQITVNIPNLSDTSCFGYQSKSLIHAVYTWYYLENAKLGNHISFFLPLITEIPDFEWDGVPTIVSFCSIKCPCKNNKIKECLTTVSAGYFLNVRPGNSRSDDTSPNWFTPRYITRVVKRHFYSHWWE